MKVLIISSSAPYGKGESFVVSEANEIARAGCDVTIFPAVIRRGQPNNFQLHKRCRVISPDRANSTVSAVFVRFLVLNLPRLLKLLFKLASNSLTNTLKNWIVLPRALWLSEYLKNHPVDHIHAHWLTTPATVAMVVSELTSIPWSATGHRGDIVANNLLTSKFHSAQFVRFISKSGLLLAKERAYLAPQKAKVIHLGVETTGFDKEDTCDRSADGLVTILCPANLVPVKGHEFLFRALAQMKQLAHSRLILAGDGELRGRLETLARELDIDSVLFFEGHVPHSHLLDWYHQSKIDIVVLPSQDLGRGVHEGIPVSLMEAMGNKVPVVATDTGGIPELLIDGDGQEFGRLVSPQDVQGLADVLDELIECPAARRSLGAAGFERVSRAFYRKKNVADLIELFEIQDSSSS